jgi:hypothetical protein
MVDPRQTEVGHHGHILALYMQSRGDFIVVGDLMRSIRYASPHDAVAVVMMLNHKTMLSVTLPYDCHHFKSGDASCMFTSALHTD